MQHSDEITGALSSLVETFGTGAMESSFANAFSDEPGTLAIGTDPDEWWDEPDQLSRSLAAQSRELEGVVTTKTLHCEGWIEGSVGWGAAKVELVGPTGTPDIMRFTATYAQRPGGWKIVQAHASIGITNTEALGKELTI